MTQPVPAAFDAFAATYDTDFSRSRLGQLLRPRVWSLLAHHFTAGDHILELACGTGEDALWLAGRGMQVTATDASPQMIRVVNGKVEAAGLTGLVTAATFSFQQLLDGAATPGGETAFDGVLSNFGGLNTINRWSELAEALAGLVRLGGRLVLAPMGPFCPWEIGWHLLHGQVQTAVRRLRGQATARIGETVIPVWYPSARRLRQAFLPWFDHVETRSLGLWLPPSYLGHLLARRPAFFERLAALEARTARLTGGWGDHYLIVFERRVGSGG